MIQSYVKQLQQVYAGPVWYGESYLEKLNSVNDRQVFLKPFKNIHSIAELISHCIFWRKALINVLDGNTYSHQVTDPENWIRNNELIKKGWGSITQELEETQHLLLKKLKQLSDDDLLKEYKPNSSLEYLVAGVIQHDVYHIGQMGLVQKMLAA